MLHWLLRPEVTGVALFQYITFRTAASSLTAMFITLLFGGWAIQKLKDFQIGQHIRKKALLPIKPKRVLQPWEV